MIELFLELCAELNGDRTVPGAQKSVVSHAEADIGIIMIVSF